MFSSGPNYPKLKTNLRLAVNRLKLLEKKKTELALKARKEIADYISTGKTERAKIRVEHIIREDYLVEAMEVTEMYCDLILARYGLIEQMKDLDEGLAEAISSLIWVAPRLLTDVAELKLIADQLALKYGKPYAQACREQAVATISEKLIHKLSVQAPPKLLVEKYLVEIAKNYNLEYEADPQILREEVEAAQDPLISLNDNDLGKGGGAAAMGGAAMNIPPTAGFQYPPTQQQPTDHPFSYPQHADIISKAGELLDLSNFVPSILLSNPQSLNNCFQTFESQVRSSNPDVVAVSETWFSGSHPASGFQMDGYTLFHDDREDRRGGGAALYIRSRLMPFTLAVEVPPVLECIWAGIGPSVFLCSLYHPPNAPTKKLLLEHLVSTVLDLRNSSSRPIKIIVAGDFNELPHERLFSSVGLQNLVKEPTHENSTIDLVLTDSPQSFGEPQLLPPIANSRHHCVLVRPVPQRLGFSGDLNLPNVPVQSFGKGPPPPDFSADNMPPPDNNFKPGTGKPGYGMGGTETGEWDALMGLEHSPPPPYSSMVYPPPPASAPPPSLPPSPFRDGAAHPGQERPNFPPDVSSQGGSNLKESNSPKPAPRSKFDGPADSSDFLLPDLPNVPDLPSVPHTPGEGVPGGEDTHEDIDFDDLNKRFEQLKKKK